MSVVQTPTEYPPCPLGVGLSTQSSCRDKVHQKEIQKIEIYFLDVINPFNGIIL